MCTIGGAETMARASAAAMAADHAGVFRQRGVHGSMHHGEWAIVRRGACCTSGRCGILLDKGVAARGASPVGGRSEGRLYGTRRARVAYSRVGILRRSNKWRVKS